MAQSSAFWSTALVASATAGTDRQGSALNNRSVGHASLSAAVRDLDAEARDAERKLGRATRQRERFRAERDAAAAAAEAQRDGARRQGMSCPVCRSALEYEVLRSALGDLRVFAATAESPGGGPPGGGPPGGAEAAAPTAAAAAAAVYLEGTAGGREGGAADTFVGRVVPADGVQGAPAGALAVADEEAYLYAEEFWVDGDEVDGVYSPRSSEVEPGL